MTIFELITSRLVNVNLFRQSYQKKDKNLLSSVIIQAYSQQKIFTRINYGGICSSSQQVTLQTYLTANDAAMEFNISNVRRADGIIADPRLLSPALIVVKLLVMFNSDDSLFNITANTISDPCTHQLLLFSLPSSSARTTPKMVCSGRKLIEERWSLQCFFGPLRPFVL